MSNVASSTTTVDWDAQMVPSGDRRGVRGRPDWTDVLFFVVLAIAAAYSLFEYHDRMDVYEQGMLIGIVPLLTWMGWLWRPLRLLTITTCLVALLAVWLYSPDGQLSHGDIQRADQVFLLKYLISSQSAILWMCALFLLATAAYWIGLASPTAAWIGIGLTWAGVVFGTEIGRASCRGRVSGWSDKDARDS